MVQNEMEGTMRKRRPSALLSLVLLLFFRGTSSAEERFQTGGHFILGFPQGEFRSNADRIGLGGDFYFAYHVPRSILSAGISIGFSIYGRETREEPLSPTIPEMIVDVSTTNSIVLGHLFLRLQPRTGMFRPYLDGLVGFHYLTTDTTIHDNCDGDGDITSNNHNDLAFSYGAGAGTQVTLIQGIRQDNKQRLFSMDLDIGIRYLRGGEAEYMKKGSIHREIDGVIYDVYRSRTDLVKAYIGLNFSF